MKRILIVSVIFVISGCSSVFRIPTPSINLTPSMPKPQATQSSTGRTQSVNQTQYAGQIAQTMFSYVMAPGGIWLWQKEFKEGEWTSWNVTTDDNDKIKIDIAYLKDAGNNRHWWRLIYNSDEEEITYEALMNHEDFSTRRLRAQFDSDEPFEVPVAEGGSYGPYGTPRRITPESLEASIQETVEVDLPAGSFQSRRGEFGVMMGQGQLELWLSDEVPGGVVKYQLTSEQSDAVGELTDYGKGAESILGSY
ncbi:MAG: hypothetical protein ACQEQC_05025 [Elusimicrobiota bacterium]